MCQRLCPPAWWTGGNFFRTSGTNVRGNKFSARILWPDWFLCCGRRQNSGSGRTFCPKGVSCQEISGPLNERILMNRPLTCTWHTYEREYRAIYPDTVQWISPDSPGSKNSRESDRLLGQKRNGLGVAHISRLYQAWESAKFGKSLRNSKESRCAIPFHLDDILREQTKQLSTLLDPGTEREREIRLYSYR